MAQLLHEPVGLLLLRQLVQQLDVYVDVYLAARVPLALQIQDCFDSGVSDLVGVGSKVELVEPYGLLGVGEDEF